MFEKQRNQVLLGMLESEKPLTDALSALIDSLSASDIKGIGLLIEHVQVMFVLDLCLSFPDERLLLRFSLC